MLNLRSTALFALVEGLIDYAGLFPPAALSLPETLDNYRRYLSSPHRFMLGRLVVPAAKLDDLPAGERWAVSALADPSALPAVERFNARGAAKVDCIEWAFSSREELDELTRRWNYLLFVEVTADRAEEVAAYLPPGGRVGLKLRTGGLKPEQFPDWSALELFWQACKRHSLPFKFTAGLHHALAGEYPLTYETDSARCSMHGFMQVFLGAALWFLRGSRLEGPLEMSWEPDAVIACGERLSSDDLRRFRTHDARSFGSCSFEEPVEELQKLGWL